MSGAKRLLLLASGIALVVGLVTDAEAQRGYVPALQDGPWLWEHPFGGQFPAVNGSALPVSQDPGHPLIPGRTWHVPDLSNPNLKPWARDVLKKEAEEIEKGKLQLSASSSCFLTGVPDFFSDGGPYLIDHTGITYLMGRSGEYLGFFPPGTSAERMVDIISRHLAAPSTGSSNAVIPAK